MMWELSPDVQQAHDAVGRIWDAFVDLVDEETLTIHWADLDDETQVLFGLAATGGALDVLMLCFTKLTGMEFAERAKRN